MSSITKAIQLCLFFMGFGASLMAQTTFSNPVGIGVTPTAQLHTTRSVRFETLAGTGTRLVLADLQGNLSALNGGTTGQVLTKTATGLAWQTNSIANGWSLTGNTGNGVTNFLGTTDNQPIIVKTANVERFRIRPTNNGTILLSDLPNPVGTWDSDPNASVIKSGMDIRYSPINYGGSIGIYATTSNAANSTSGEGTATGYLSSASNWHAASSLTGVGGYIIANRITAPFRISTSGGGVFSTNFQNATLTSSLSGSMVGGVVGILNGNITTQQNTVVAAMIAQDQINTANTYGAYVEGKSWLRGNVGINTTGTATASLHNKGTVRFEDLPNGDGNMLVVDANGNVFKSTCTCGQPLQSDKKLLDKINEAQAEIENLKRQIEKLENAMAQSSEKSIFDTKTSAQLFQNAPNPFNENTVIKYSLPENSKNAALYVYDMSGRLLKTFDNICCGEGSVTLEASQLTAGMYIYTLIADSKEVGSKRMILTK